jgi:TolB-like protein
MPRLQLKVLGGFDARWASGPAVDIATKKSRALLAYLALPAGRGHARSKLVDLLWSNRGDEQARNSLRQALTELGRALETGQPGLLIKDHDTIALDAGAVEVDALVFERLTAAGNAEDLRRADELFVGDLLDGIDIPDPNFEDWLRLERQRLRDFAVTAVKKLLALETGQAAVVIAKRLVALDPLQEEGHQTLMRLRAEAGETGAALRQYEACRDILKRELNIVPSQETEELNRAIRTRHRTLTAPQPTITDSSLALAATGQSTEMPSSSKPSVAVLPFTNLSGDPEQQYFSDGITEDIITGLSRFREFIVVARHSSFRFRDSAADIKHVGRELGVRYIVEGSVRRTGDNISIAAQLIDATHDVNLWAERYDRNASEIFAIQHEVVQAVVGTFAGQLEHAARERARRQPTDSLAAYDCYLRAHDDMWRLYYDTEAYLREGLTAARKMCYRAIEFDPRYARPHACLGFTHLCDWLYRGTSEDLDKAVRCARAAVSIDDADDWCHATLGVIHLKRAEHDRAEYHMQRAIELNPNDADTYCTMGLCLIYAGLPLPAIERLQTAIRRNPFCPDYYHESLGMAYYLAHCFDEAIAALHHMRKLTSWAHAYLAACYAQLGRLDEAQAEAAEYIRQARSTSGALVPGQPDPLKTLISALDADLRTHKKVVDYQLWLDGMQKAGLPI